LYYYGERNNNNSVGRRNFNFAIVPNIDHGRPLQYNIINYSDDIAGCEAELENAINSFLSLGSLRAQPGLAHPQPRWSS
jgi:hypothetical protein